MENAFIACWKEHAKGREAPVPSTWKSILGVWEAAGVGPEVVCALVLLVWAHPIDNSPHYPWYVLCDSVADHISHAGDWVDL